MNMPKQKRILSIVLKCIVILAACSGTWLTAATSADAVGVVFMFFTIQSNLLVALISAVGLAVMLCGKRIGSVMHVINYIGVVSITLTCFVFTFVLAPTMGDLAWTVYNVLTHLVAPIAFITDFFITAVYGDLRKRHLWFVLIPPAAYLVFSAIAFWQNWEFLDGKHYPYFFLNWGSPAGAFGFTDELPFMGCVWWIMALGVLIFLVGFLYLRIVDKLKGKLKQA